MIGLRGLGGVDVGPLAAAQFQGQINGSFDAPWYQAPYMPTGQLTQAPALYYMDAGTVAQIASLVGGSPTLCPVNMQGAPQANCISLADGVWNPGPSFPPGVILSYPDECAAEQSLLSEVPGGQLSAACAAGGTGETPAQKGATTAQGSTAVPGSNFPGEGPCCESTAPISAPPPPPQYVPPVVAAPIGPVVVPISAPAPLPAPAQSSGSQVIAAPNPPAPAPPPVAPPVVATPTVVSPCFNPISQWIGADTCLGPLGIIEWALLAGGALYLLTARGGRR